MIKQIDFGHSINFVDSKDKFVGIDTRDKCCEVFCYYWTKDGKVVEFEEIEDELVFCVFSDEPPQEVYKERTNSVIECHAKVIFDVVAENPYNKPDAIYSLVAENKHNGYYIHGWKVGELVVTKKGYI